MKKFIFYSSIILNIVFVLFFIGKRYYYSHSEPAYKGLDTNILNLTNTYNNRMDSIYNLLSLDSNDIVFVGDSRTAQLPLSEYFNNPHIKNRGISGNETIHVNRRLMPIVSAHPKKIFLEIGLNDLSNHQMSVKETMDNIDLICTAIQARSPHTKIYVENISPIRYDDSAVSKKIVLFNNSLKHYADSAKFVYIDLYPQFMKNGKVNPGLYTDDAHFTAQGDKIVMEELRKYLQ